MNFLYDGFSIRWIFYTFSQRLAPPSPGLDVTLVLKSSMLRHYVPGSVFLPLSMEEAIVKHDKPIKDDIISNIIFMPLQENIE